jgi:predicted methyltransferase
MLSDIVGPKGELHMYDPLFAAPLADAGKAFVATHPNTKFQNLDFNNIEFPKGIDVVWCYACFHEVLGTGVDIDPFFAKMYKAMKPGARFLMVFYTARDGKSRRRDPAPHRYRHCPGHRPGGRFPAPGRNPPAAEYRGRQEDPGVHGSRGRPG